MRGVSMNDWLHPENLLPALLAFTAGITAVGTV